MDNSSPNCLHCPDYVDCRTRINRMKKVKARHGSNNPADIRFRICAMEWIAKGCQKQQPQVLINA